MKSLFLPLALAGGALVLSAQQCSSGGGGGAKAAVEPARLQRTWLHAHEEDHGDTVVFRPNTYAFPPSRGRTGFKVESGGTLIQYDIAPTDGLEEHKGTWRFDKDTFHATFPDKSSADYRLRILHLDDQRLEAVRTFVGTSSSD